MITDKILLGHGSGGRLMHDLISSLFIKNFSDSEIPDQTDSAIVSLDPGKIAFTTDSFVVDPIFFPGGDIGKLAVCGTVNDIAVSGATPVYLSASFILEEGLPFLDLERVVKSMAEEAKRAGVRIVTGDTKVVNRGKCDKIFITTTGIGSIAEANENIGKGSGIKPGDKIIVNGSLGDHGMAVMSAREDLGISSNIVSDCASLNHLIARALAASDHIKFMRDATRGGLATVLSELVSGKNFGIEIRESELLVRENVRGFCELLGFDPLYVANEGKVVMVVASEDAERVVNAMKQDEFGIDSRIIGEITSDHFGKAWMATRIGGKRIIDMLAGEQLPRIC